ncbi:unnamed protein product [Caenorhabditis auriculariae]|uniref:Uncharacterized protein n=1 Tax=Caenorhabditis auriculariae TaxID=2777116 RepID=A0A8S1H1L1_9PELO|nr:unnamed protein product [Caenorhabditis auriculariae]
MIPTGSPQAPGDAPPRERRSEGSTIHGVDTVRPDTTPAHPGPRFQLPPMGAAFHYSAVTRMTSTSSPDPVVLHTAHFSLPPRDITNVPCSTNTVASLQLPMADRELVAAPVFRLPPMQDFRPRGYISEASLQLPTADPEVVAAPVFRLPPMQDDRRGGSSFTASQVRPMAAPELVAAPVFRLPPMQDFRPRGYISEAEREMATLSDESTDEREQVDPLMFWYTSSEDENVDGTRSEAHDQLPMAEPRLVTAPVFRLPPMQDDRRFGSSSNAQQQTAAAEPESPIFRLPPPLQDLRPRGFISEASLQLPTAEPGLVAAPVFRLPPMQDDRPRGYISEASLQLPTADPELMAAPVFRLPPMQEDRRGGASFTASQVRPMAAPELVAPTIFRLPPMQDLRPRGYLSETSTPTRMMALESVAPSPTPTDDLLPWQRGPFDGPGTTTSTPTRMMALQPVAPSPTPTDELLPWQRGPFDGLGTTASQVRPMAAPELVAAPVFRLPPMQDFRPRGYISEAEREMAIFSDESEQVDSPISWFPSSQDDTFRSTSFDSEREMSTSTDDSEQVESPVFRISYSQDDTLRITSSGTSTPTRMMALQPVAPSPTPMDDLLPWQRGPFDGPERTAPPNTPTFEPEMAASPLIHVFCQMIIYDYYLELVSALFVPPSRIYDPDGIWFIVPPNFAPEIVLSPVIDIFCMLMFHDYNLQLVYALFFPPSGNNDSNGTSLTAPPSTHTVAPEIMKSRYVPILLQLLIHFYYLERFAALSPPLPPDHPFARSPFTVPPNPYIFAPAPVVSPFVRILLHLIIFVFNRERLSAPSPPESHLYDYTPFMSSAETTMESPETTMESPEERTSSLTTNEQYPAIPMDFDSDSESTIELYR